MGDSTLRIEHKNEIIDVAVTLREIDGFTFYMGKAVGMEGCLAYGDTIAELEEIFPEAIDDWRGETPTVISDETMKAIKDMDY